MTSRYSAQHGDVSSADQNNENSGGLTLRLKSTKQQWNYHVTVQKVYLCGVYWTEALSKCNKEKPYWQWRIWYGAMFNTWLEMNYIPHNKPNLMRATKWLSAWLPLCPCNEKVPGLTLGLVQCSVGNNGIRIHSISNGDRYSSNRWSH